MRTKYDKFVQFFGAVVASFCVAACRGGAANASNLASTAQTSEIHSKTLASCKNFAVKKTNFMTN
jgi:hypothetical protein